MSIYKKVLIISILTVVGISMHAMEKSNQDDQSVVTDQISKTKQVLTFWQNIIKGSLIGIAEVTCNQPLVRLKNDLQQGKSITINPKALYKGYGVNAGSMAPITAMQVAISGWLTKYFATRGEPTLQQKVMAAYMAGAASALLATPTEMIMIHQQIMNQNAVQTVRHMHTVYGKLSLMKGFMPTSIRDGCFAVGYLTLSQMIRQMYGLNTKSEFVNNLSGAIPAGIITTAVTHPFDTIKTSMQAQIANPQYSNMIRATNAIIQKDGIKGLYKGMSARGTRVVFALALMGYLSEHTDKYIL